MKLGATRAGGETEIEFEFFLILNLDVVCFPFLGSLCFGCCFYFSFSGTHLWLFWRYGHEMDLHMLKTGTKLEESLSFLT